jgi:hypothetical protein
MALGELERKAVQKLEQEIGERLEREQKALNETQLKWTKMQIRWRQKSRLLTSRGLCAPAAVRPLRAGVPDRASQGHRRPLTTA